MGRQVFEAAPGLRAWALAGAAILEPLLPVDLLDRFSPGARLAHVRVPLETLGSPMRSSRGRSDPRGLGLDRVRCCRRGTRIRFVVRENRVRVELFANLRRSVRGAKAAQPGCLLQLRRHDELLAQLDLLVLDFPIGRLTKSAPATSPRLQADQFPFRTPRLFTLYHPKG